MAKKQGCLFALFSLFFPSSDGDEELPYVLRDDFMSRHELNFYNVLKLIVDSRATIFTKVRISDLVFVKKSENHMKYFNKISSKHVDFVICDNQTLKPLFAIELDDSSHLSDSRQGRDELVNKVFDAAKLPLLHFSAKSSYEVNLIKPQIDKFFIPKVEAGTIDKPQVMAENQVPLCPKCNISMVLRKSERGENAGKEFYGCVNYPRCRQVVSI